MKPTNYTARVVLTLGVAAGAWSLAASMPGAQTPPAAPAEATGFAAMVAGADIAAGQAASLQCIGCHTVAEGEAPRFGPTLFGIVDRPVASVEGFNYSPAMAAVGAAGGTWSVDFLNEFLTSPQAAIPGTTMPFGGIADEATRANLIGYLATLTAGAAPVEAATGTPVTFTTAQADRGQSRYTRDCEECHGATLNGGLIGGPPLRGLAFEQKYLNGTPAAVLFTYTSTAMPPDNPGRFSPAVYADLVAYILSHNGFEPGTEELPNDLETLNTLIMAH